MRAKLVGWPVLAALTAFDFAVGLVFGRERRQALRDQAMPMYCFVHGEVLLPVSVYPNGISVRVECPRDGCHHHGIDRIERLRAAGIPVEV